MSLQNAGAMHGRNRYLKGICRPKANLDPELVQALFDANVEFTANPVYAKSTILLEFFPLGKVRMTRIWLILNGKYLQY